MKSLFVLFLMIFSLVANAETFVGGLIETNETWYTSGSPYLVESPVTLGDNVVLTIEPGVEVLIAEGISGIIVYPGQLVCQGTANNPIVFSSREIAENPSYETALALHGVDEVQISFVEIANASTGIEVGYNSFSGNNIRIRNCHHGIQTMAGIVNLTESTIRDCFIGINAEHFTELYVSHSTFKNMEFTGLNLDSSVYFNLVSSCTFQNNATGAAGPLVIENSSFSNNSSNAVVLFMKGEISDCNFVGTEGSQVLMKSIQPEATVRINQNNFNITGGYCLEVGLGCTAESIDATGNFWGVVDPEVIGSLILDANDDSDLVSIVNFNPFSQVVAISKISFSELKSMYR